MWLVNTIIAKYYPQVPATKYWAILHAVELTKVYGAKVAGVDKEVSAEEIAKPSAWSERQRCVDVKRCGPVGISTQSTAYTR